MAYKDCVTLQTQLRDYQQEAPFAQQKINSKLRYGENN